MNREIGKFKAKELDTDNWVTGHYLVIWKEHFISTSDGYLHQIDLSTLCQLITKIDDVEIYEYNCYYYKGLASYLYYNHKGILTVRFIDYKKNDFIVPDCEASEDDLIYKDFDKFSCICNFHDGEDYLLKRIKEVENE